MVGTLPLGPNLIDDHPPLITFHRLQRLRAMLEKPVVPIGRSEWMM